MVPVVDERVKFGVQVDEGDGDGWPAIRQTTEMLAADAAHLARLLKQEKYPAGRTG